MQQYLAAGLLDELLISVVPVILGGGARLFDNLADAKPELEQIEAIEAPGVTHIRYAPARGRGEPADYAPSTAASPSHEARSSSSARTAFAIARVNLTSSWIACTRSLDALRSAAASTFPTRRSPWRIGRAK